MISLLCGLRSARRARSFFKRKASRYRPASMADVLVSLGPSLILSGSE